MANKNCNLKAIKKDKNNEKTQLRAPVYVNDEFPENGDIDEPYSKRTLESVDEVDGVTNEDCPVFTIFDGIFILISIGSLIFDQVTDIILAIYYFRQEQYWFFGLTVACVVVPILITNSFSLKWYIEDTSKEKKVSKAYWALRIIFVVFQISQLFRYFETLATGIKSRWFKNKNEKYKKLLLYDDNDACLLRLFEAFMESGPQLILQIYILSKGVQIDTGYSKPIKATIQSVSIFSSLVSMAWAMAAYQRSLRFSLENKMKLSWMGSIFQFLWFAGTLWSRVLALALFASVFPIAFSAICGIHWLIMSTWIIVQNTEFCSNKYEEVLYNFVVGFIYIFCYFNVKDEKTRWKYIAYYTVTFVESTILMVLWYINSTEWAVYRVPCMVGFFGSFTLGLLFMFVFYICFHPSKRLLYSKKVKEKKMCSILELHQLDPSKLKLEEMPESVLRLNAPSVIGS